MGDPVAAAIQSVREEVVPTPAEREDLMAVVDEVIDRAEASAGELPVTADVRLVGSAARDTWLRGERDIDVFVRFPTGLTRSELREYGLAVGHDVIPDGREEYAEHPYVTGEVQGYDVDIVPCYDVDDAASIRSAVDRTPFHTAYIETHLDPDQTTDVRLLKQFLDAHDLYGSNLRTRGCSGYLTELLVIAYGDFRSVIEAAATWQPPVTLDPADHGGREFTDQLIVIDPTDPERNVAAVVSTETVARFQHHARRLLDDPDPSRFESPERPPIDRRALNAHLERRAATPIAINVPRPNIVEDELYPQLRKTRRSIAAGLAERGFPVLRSAAFANRGVLLYFELETAEQTAIERHPGPPVHVAEHADAFLEKYRDADVYGPFIDEDRYVVERERRWTSAGAFLRSDAIFDLRIGADLEANLRTDREVLIGEAILELVPDWGTELGEYYDPIP